jgi:hypothetical protein
MERCETLSEIRIDNYWFKATWSPLLKNACILWFKDDRVSTVYEPLGKFTRYEQRRVLDFITRYVTNEELREYVDSRKFEARLNIFPKSFFEGIDSMDSQERIRAFEYLYDLDGEIESQDLSKKRKIMAKKFHPDRGGSNQAMSVINEAYETLSTRVRM